MTAGHSYGQPIAEATVGQEASAADRVIVVATCPQWQPHSLFEYWVRPELLREWWPPAAVIEPFSGGAYRLEWPRQHWTLRGTYIAFDPGRELAFTWHWDHDPLEVPETQVRVTFTATEDPMGTRVRVGHGLYPDTPEGSEWRQGHLDGWLHFLARLGQLSPST